MSILAIFNFDLILSVLVVYIWESINKLWFYIKIDISEELNIIKSHMYNHINIYSVFMPIHLLIIVVSCFCLPAYFFLITMISILMYVINFNYILNKNFSLIKSIKNIILFRICIVLLMIILGYNDIIISWLPYIIVGLVVFSLIFYEKRMQKILKILFLIYLWTSIYLVYFTFLVDLDLFSLFNDYFFINQNLMTLFLAHYISDNLDISTDTKYESDIWKILIQKSLAYYIIDGFELYSNLNPENSKDILNAIDKIVKNLNLEQFGGGGGGPNWNPDLKLYIAKGLFLDAGDSPDITTNLPRVADLEAASKEIDDFNKKLNYLKNHEMIKEKNSLLLHNENLDYQFLSPHDVSDFDVHHPDSFINGSFWHRYMWAIDDDINYYNKLTGAKYYYEHINKEDLPDAFSIIWLDWHQGQAFPLHDINKENDLDVVNHKKSNIYQKNYCKKEVAYGELNDNLLIVGLSLACRIYIYEKLIIYVGTGSPENPFNNVAQWEIYLKYWELYKEFQEKYYMFFDHYRWHTKLFKLENLTKEGLETEMKYSKILLQKLKSLPPIDSDYHQKYLRFSWSTWNGYVLNPKFKDTFFMKSLTSTFHWPGMEKFINLKVANKLPINPCKADVFTDAWLENQELIIQHELQQELRKEAWDKEWKQLNNIDYR